MTALADSIACISNGISVFERINDPDCSVAIWKRPAPDGLDALLADGSKDLRFECGLSELRETLASELEAQGLGGVDAHEAFIEDVFELAQAFCNVIGQDGLELRLERVTTNSCRKFHADYVTMRLITTYIGRGTQWLDSDGLEASGNPERHARSLATGDVGLFKGKLAEGEAAIHRSPPIAGTGEKRLLLVLNPRTTEQQWG